MARLSQWLILVLILASSSVAQAGHGFWYGGYRHYVHRHNVYRHQHYGWYGCAAPRPYVRVTWGYPVHSGCYSYYSPWTFWNRWSCGYSPVVYPQCVVPCWNSCVSTTPQVVIQSPQIVHRAPQPAFPAIEPRVREMDWGRRRSSDQDLRDGDTLFRSEDYESALTLYDDAVRQDPTLVEAHFRKAQALLARQRYAEAAAAFRKGMQLNPDLSRTSLQISSLYPQSARKQRHYEEMAQQALREPGNADLMLLIGMMMRLDHQDLRAQKFFERAEQLDAPSLPAGLLTPESRPSAERLAGLHLTKT